MLYGRFFYFLSLLLGLATGGFKKLPNQHKVKGTIVSLGQHHKRRHNRRVINTAVVLYHVEGKTYHVKSTYQSSHLQPGKSIEVCYDAEDPAKKNNLSHYLRGKLACVISENTFMYNYFFMGAFASFTASYGLFSTPEIRVNS